MTSFLDINTAIGFMIWPDIAFRYVACNHMVTTRVKCLMNPIANLKI